MSNIDIKVTADVVDLQAKFALAKAESSAFSSELNKLAKEAAAAGGPNDELKAKIYAVAEQSTVAKAKVAELRTEIKTATDTSGGFAGALGEINPLLGAFGVALSIGAVEQFGQSLLENAAHIEHEAEVLGLSSSAYQAFAKSAELAEVPIDTVEGALKRFNAAQGKAQEGAIAQAAAFRELGVDARLPAEEALPAVASALLAMSDTAERARIETLLFGRSGQELNPVLEQWAEGVDGLTRKLNDLGVMLDPEITAKAEAAKKEMTLFSEQLRTGVVDAAVAAYPYLKKIGDELLLISGLQGVLDQLPKPGEKEDVRVTASPIDPNADYRAEIAGLNALDTKLVEREALTGKIRQAQLALMDATERGDAAGIRTATEVISDLQKQLDALNKPPHVSNKAANEAREAADAQTQAWVQANEKRIASDEHTNAFLLEMGRETLEQSVEQAKSLEEQRHNIQLKALRERESTDAGNKVALAKDLAAEQVIEQDYHDRLAAIDEDYQKKKRKLAQDTLNATTQDEVNAAKAELDLTSTLLDREVSLYQITASEKLDTLKVATEKEFAVEIAAEQQKLDAMKANGEQNTAAFLATSNKLIELKRQETIKLEQLNTQAAKQAVDSWKSIVGPIESGTNSMFSSMLQGQQSFAQSGKQALIQIVSEYASARLKIEFDWLAGAAARALGDQQWAEKSVLEQIAIWLGLETQKTAAATTGDAARAAADAGAAAEAIASSKGQALGEIPAYTGIAAMGAASAVAAIPVVGPALAAAAAAEMDSLGAAQLALASAKGGEWMVRGDGVPYSLHEREAVIPAPIADPMRAFFENGAAGRFDGSLPGAAAMNGATHYHSHEWNIGSDLSPDHILRDPTKRRIFERYIENEFAKAVK